MSGVSPGASTVLDPDSASGVARALGLDVEAGTARLLSGGVSSTVVSVDGRPPAVLKQALPRLKVPTDWDADPARSATEADALRLLHSLTPQHVPEVLASDAVSHIIAVRRAPQDWRDWRSVLLKQPKALDVDRGFLAGTVLGTWHAATWGNEKVRSRFEHAQAFDELRVDPFHRELVRRATVPAALVEPLIRELSDARDCLVHGDFSPKNMLVGDSGMWIIDAEVAHVGAAVFDLAFLVAHLAVKSVHTPPHSPVLYRSARAFLAGYEQTNPRQVTPTGVARHAAAIMLARVFGKSPAPYLSAAEGATAADVALRTLAAAEASIDMLWTDPETAVLQ